MNNAGNLLTKTCYNSRFPKNLESINAFKVAFIIIAHLFIL